MLRVLLAATLCLLAANSPLALAQGHKTARPGGQLQTARYSGYLGELLQLAARNRHAPTVKYVRELRPVPVKGGEVAFRWIVTDQSGTYDAAELLKPGAAPLIGFAYLTGHGLVHSEWWIGTTPGTLPRSSLVSVDSMPRNIRDGGGCDLVFATLFRLLPSVCGEAEIVCMLLEHSIVTVFASALCYVLENGSSPHNIGWYGEPRDAPGPTETWTASQPVDFVADNDLYGDPPCINNQTDSNCHMIEGNGGISGARLGNARVTWDWQIFWPDGTSSSTFITSSTLTVLAGVQHYHFATMPVGAFVVTVSLYDVNLSSTDGGQSLVLCCLDPPAGTLDLSTNYEAYLVA